MAEPLHLMDDTAPTSTPSSAPPPLSWAETAKLAAQVSVPDCVPHAARAAVADALGRCLRYHHGELGWWRIFAFAPLVLSAETAARGGTKDRARILMEKAKLFADGKLDELIVRARAAADTMRATRQQQQEHDASFLVEDDSRWAVGVTTDATAATVSEQRIAMASKLAQKGLHAKAVRSLDSAKIAPCNAATVAQLQLLHPDGEEVNPVLLPPDLDPHQPLQDSYPSEKDLSTMLRGMRGSAAGLSRLFPSLLQQLIAVPGTQLQVGLSSVVADIARGNVPPAARPYFFGARLIALEKKQGGVRPIACGDVLRRLAGKWLCSLVRKEAGVYLSTKQQAGVCVERGAEGLIHTARRLCAEWAHNPEMAMLKVDFHNAFNSIDRDALLGEAHRFPVLLRYAAAAYGEPTVLLFGGQHVIASSAGVQQGDPLGPLFFSLVLARVWSSAVSCDAFPAADISLAGWYLDDGVIGGSPTALAKVLSLLEEHGQAAGLRLNRSKCELRVTTMDHRELPADVVIGDLADTELLGCAIGSPFAHDLHAASVAKKAARRLDLIARMGEVHGHSAMATLRFCGGFPMCGHLLRAGGAFPDMGVVDEATRRAFLSVVAPCNSNAWQQAQLPLRLGGFGVRLLRTYAAPASFASALLSAATVGKYYQGPALPADPLLLSSATLIAAAHPFLADTVKAIQRGDVVVQDGKVQRALSKAIDEKAADTLLEKARNESVVSVARLQSARGDFASAWLGVFDTSAAPWLANDEFRTACCLRLGLPVCQAPAVCSMCGAAVDAEGHHMIACKKGKHAVHNALRNTLHSLCAQALLPAVREGMPFAAQGGDAARQRMDIIVSAGPDLRPLLLDVAVTSPFVRPSIAARFPGGAATAYENVKRRTYGPAVQEQVHNFVPLIVDSLGAWGKSALPTLKFLAAAFASRRAEAHGEIWRGRSIFFATLSLSLQRRLAHIICRSVPAQAEEFGDGEPRDDESDVDSVGTTHSAAPGADFGG